MTSLMNFMKIYELVQKLLGETETGRQNGDFISLTFICLRKVSQKYTPIMFLISINQLMSVADYSCAFFKVGT
jgi:hypothetical protein